VPDIPVRFERNLEFLDKCSWKSPDFTTIRPVGPTLYTRTRRKLLAITTNYRGLQHWIHIKQASSKIFCERLM